MCDDVMSVYQNLKYTLNLNINSVSTMNISTHTKKRKTELWQNWDFFETAFHECKHCSKPTAIMNPMCLYTLKQLKLLQVLLLQM